MPPETIVAKLRALARQDPDRLFCTLLPAGEQITYGGLLRRSDDYAEAFRRVGVGTGEPVIIILRHRPELFYAFFGAMLARGIPSFMPFPSGKQDHARFWRNHRELFRLIGVRVLVTDGEFRGGVDSELGSLALRILNVDSLAVSAVEDPADKQTSGDPDADPDSIAFLQHSSGTTGLKKGVMLSHRAVIRQVEDYAAATGFGADDVIASWLPLYHDMGLIACLMMTVITGARLVQLDAFDWVARPSLLLDAIAAHRAGFVWLPNFALLHLTRTAPPQRVWDLRSLRAVIDCSEPCTPEALEQFATRFGVAPAALLACYAMAENVFAVTQTPPGEGPRILAVDNAALEARGVIAPAAAGSSRRFVSCGRPLAGVEIAIVDARRQHLPDSRVGEIAIRTPTLFAGYNKLSKLTREKLSEGWYYTGDLGFRHEDELYVIGRADDLMIIYGRNFYATAVEEVLNRCAGVVPGRVVVFAVDNPRSGTRDAVALLEAEAESDAVELRRRVKIQVFDELGLTLHLVEIVPSRSLIKSTAGKISRSQNKERFLAGAFSLG